MQRPSPKRRPSRRRPASLPSLPALTAFLVLLALLGAAGPHAAAQDGAETSTEDAAEAEVVASNDGSDGTPDGSGSTPFVETVDVNVVNVEVYVTDKDGNRVTGLTRDDFELRVDRKPVAITNFYAVEGGRLLGDGREVEPIEEPERRLVREEQPPRLPDEQQLHLVVYVDNLNLHPFTRNRVLGQARTFLRTHLRPGDRVMLVTYERSIHTRVPFTTDPEIVASALYDVEEMSAQAIHSDSDRRDMLELIYEADDVYEVRGRILQHAESIYSDMSFTLDALKSLIETIAGLPGRKAILYVSDGLPMRAGDDLFHAMQDRFPAAGSILLEGQRYDLTRRFQGLTSKANSSRVTFYTVDAEGLRTYSYLEASNPTLGGGSRIDQVHFNNLQSSLRFMAQETGGLAMINSNNYGPMFERMAEDFDNYYSLGFTPAASESGRYRRIDVEVKGGKKLQVRHRDGYRDRSLSARMADGTMAALHYGYQDNDLGVLLDFGEITRHEGGKFLVPLRVLLPLGNLTFLPQEEMQRARVRLFVAAMDEEGGVAPVSDVPVPIDVPEDEFAEAREGYYQYEVKLIMRGGPQVVAVGVRDEIGSVSGFVTRGVRVGG